MTIKMRRLSLSSSLTFAFAFPLLLLATAARGVRAQELPKFDFLATHYDVQVELHPESQSISAVAKVELVAQTASRNILVELHPDLHVESVNLAIDGRKLDFQRDGTNPLDLEVTLPSSAEPQMHVTLIFHYAGSFSNDDDSPTKDVRFAWVDQKSAYLLLPARWFPLTAYPSNRYTGVFQITAPDDFAVVGTGTAPTPNEIPAEKPGGSGRVVYTFTSSTPGPVGTFVAGNLQLSPVHAQGVDIPVYAPAGSADLAQRYGDALARMMTYDATAFGVLPDRSITLAQMPDGSLEGYSAPGLILLSARDWTAKMNQGELARLAAGQWWGNQVLPASEDDRWITDGLSQYAGAMYIEHEADAAGFHNELTDFAIGAVTYEGAAPIAQSQELQPYSPQFNSIVVDKGAMVFHMLRTAMGDTAFNSLLMDFYTAHAGKTASIDQFEQLAQTKLPPAKPGEPSLNLVAFFSQWVNSTGIPDFKVNYIVYRTPKGFRVVGKIQQPLETFNMPVDIRVETEGNPVTKTIQVVGPTTEFQVDTFGEPKPDGITLDPDNDILKASPMLKVRALIAKGEGMAEQGKFSEAIQQYQAALALKSNSSLADFRIGEAYFYQKNYSAAADSFRSALDGDLDPGSRWVEVWSHIYLGKIFDLTGSRERAINEYEKARELKDNTDGAQDQAAKYLKTPFTLTPAGAQSAPNKPATKPELKSEEKTSKQ